jgi:hypothetical protein
MESGYVRWVPPNFLGAAADADEPEVANDVDRGKGDPDASRYLIVRRCL